MPSKDIKKLTVAKVRGLASQYRIVDMDGMADIKVLGRLVMVDDELSHEEVGWIADQWVEIDADEDRNLTQHTLKVKSG